MMSCEQTLASFDGLEEINEQVISSLRHLASRPQELSSYKPRSLARTALAAASASPAMLEVLSKLCCLVAEDGSADLAAFEPQDLTMTCWALATAGYRDVPAMTALGWQIADRAWDFYGEDLAKVLRAFAELGISHQGMMSSVSMEIIWKIDQFSASSLSQVAESCARLDYCAEPMFEWLAGHVMNRLSEYSGPDLARVMWAFGQASVRHEALASCVAAEVTRRGFEELPEEDLARLIWSFSHLGLPAPGVTQLLYHPSLATASLG